MLTEILLLLFDTSLYYTVFGFWFRMFAHEAPSYAGFLLLAAMICLHAFLRERGEQAGQSASAPSRRPGFGAGGKASFLLLAIPAAGAAVLMAAGQAGAFGLSPLQAAFMVLPAAYLAYCFYRGMTDIDLSNFRDHFRTGAWILLAVLPGVIASSKGLQYLAEVAPYLIVMLASGVTGLRNLRDNGTHRAWHGACVAGALAASWVFTAIHMPRLIGQALLLIYSKVLAPILYAFAIAMAYLLAWAFELLRKLHDILGIQPPPEQIGDNEYVTPGDEAAEMSEQIISSRIFEIIGIAVIIILIAAALIFVFRRLTTRRNFVRSRSKASVLSRTILTSAETDGGPSARLFRPRDPRLAVRWYYARFLREALSRGVSVEPDLTGSEIGRRSKTAFAGAAAASQASALAGDSAGGPSDPAIEPDPSAGVRELYDVYAPARYSGHSVTEADVRRMRAALKKLK